MKKIFFTTILSIFIIYSCAPSRISDDPNSNSDGLLLNVLGPIIATADRERIKNSIVSMPTGLLKTGQTGVYQTWDDGTYQKGIARTFITGGTTGLLWQRCSAGQNNDPTCSGKAQSYSWENANSYCNSLSLGGKSWRLPTVNELANLVDYSKSNSLAIDSSIFPNTELTFYWSSSAPSREWYAVFLAGNVRIFASSEWSWEVRCVTEP
jgi:hypothetical protein